MHCGTHWRAFWPEKARFCPIQGDIFADKHKKITFFCFSIWRFKNYSYLCNPKRKRK